MSLDEDFLAVFMEALPAGSDSQLRQINRASGELMAARGLAPNLPAHIPVSSGLFGSAPPMPPAVATLSLQKSPNNKRRPAAYRNPWYPIVDETGMSPRDIERDYRVAVGRMSKNQLVRFDINLAPKLLVNYSGLYDGHGIRSGLGIPRIGVVLQQNFRGKYKAGATILVPLEAIEVRP